MGRYYSDTRIPTLDEALLNRMSVNKLRKLAKLTNKKIPSRKSDIAALIKQHLAGDRLEAVWRGLDELQRAAVAEVVHSDTTKFLTDRIIAKYGSSPKLYTTDNYGYKQTPTVLAFFFYDRVMPDDLKERLKVFVPKPPISEIKTLPDLPANHDLPVSRWSYKEEEGEEETIKVPLAVHRSEQIAQQELLSVLRLIDSGKVCVSDKRQRPTAATVRAVSKILEGGDYYPVLPVKDRWHDENAGPIRAFAWPLVVLAGGLAKVSGSRLKLTDAGRKALLMPAGDTLRKLWSSWIKSTIFDELSRVECIKGQTGKGKHRLTPVSYRRHAIVQALEQCPVGYWISIDEFQRFIVASGNDFIVTQNAWNLYICDRQYGSLGFEGGERIINERYLFAFLLEYAATLGVIDVALVPPAGARPDYYGLWGTDDLPYFSRYDGLMYFRITKLGSYCLGIQSEYRSHQVHNKPVFKILPNLEIVATEAGMDHCDQIALDNYAMRLSDLVWRLDRSKLLSAVEVGHGIDKIKEFLVAHSDGEIPYAVTCLLDEVAECSEKFKDLGLARLIECDDPGLAAFIAGNSQTRKHCMLAGKRHLVVPASSDAAFKRALRKLGYLIRKPVQSDEETDSAE